MTMSANISDKMQILRIKNNLSIW